jgi:hypothetical protein
MYVNQPIKIGECLLNKLDFYHPIKSTNIDFMHSIFLGVMKNMFSYWFDTSNKNYSLSSNIIELNKRLLNCRYFSLIN